MTYTIEVHVSGPLSRGEIPDILDRALRDAQGQVGAQALAYWHTGLNASIKHPTPYYETQITVQNVAQDVVVHDRGIVYGPWLEGVGSRNRTTRFKGYHALRNAAQQTEARAPGLVQRVFDIAIREANGA